MNDDLAVQLASACVEQETRVKGFKSSPHLGRLSDVIAWLRTNGVNIWDLLKNLRKVFDIINDASLPWLEKLAKIVELFFPPERKPAIDLPEFA